MRLDLDTIRKRWKGRIPPDIADAMLEELERLYAAPVAEPVQPTTPGAREAAIEGELRRMVTKPRGVTLTPSPVCQGCGSLAVFVQSSEEGGTIHVCGNCWREWQ